MTIKQVILTILIAVLVSTGVQMAGSRHNDAGAAFNAIKPAAGSAFDRVMATRTLRCGYVAYPPYLNVDPATGAKTGLIADLMAEVGRRLDLKIEWSEEASWGTMIEGIEAGRYDAVCSAIWQNASRSVHADFSQPIGYATVDAWVRTGDARFDGNPAKINGKDVKIAVIDGEMGSIIAKDRFSGAQTVSLPQQSPYSDMMINVATGKADVAFIETQLAMDYIAHNPGSLKRVDAPALAAYPITVMLPKGDQRLKSMIDSAIGEIMLTGKFDAILAAGKTPDTLFHRAAAPYVR